MTDKKFMALAGACALGVVGVGLAVALWPAEDTRPEAQRQADEGDALKACKQLERAEIVAGCRGVPKEGLMEYLGSIAEFDCAGETGRILALHGDPDIRRRMAEGYRNMGRELVLVSEKHPFIVDVASGLPEAKRASMTKAFGELEP